jgi:type I restriction enzyme S subunit
MRFEDFRDIPGLLPPLPEQEQIVSFLDEKTSKIDVLIKKKEQKIELLKEYRTSLINRVITKGLNPDVPMKDSGVEWIGEIPSHWDFPPIKFLVSTPLTDGPHETPVFFDEGIPFLSVEGVVGDKIDFSRIRGFISLESHIQYSKKCKPQRDDVLLVKSGSTTGKSTIVETDVEFNVWSPLCIVRSDIQKVLPRFMFLVFQSGVFRLLIEHNWSYGTQPNIGMGVIENIRIVLPPLSEQEQIVSYLDHKTGEIDSTIDSEKKKIDLLKEYRQSLISSVITGKIKVVD